MKIIPVILAGGKGTRLWPLSRSATPKQYAKLTSPFSLMQNSIMRLDYLSKEINFSKPIIVCNNDDKFIVQEQLIEINKKATLILEPFGRNTAPPIAICSFMIDDPDSIIFVMAADHEIDNLEQLNSSLMKAVDLANNEKIITFGVTPKSPHTGYGYIKKGNKYEDGFLISSFEEKPNYATAKKYLVTNNYLWNSGMFVSKTSVFLNELKCLSPKIYDICKNESILVNVSESQFKIDENIFKLCPNDSIDYAIMEKTKEGVMVELNAGWNDIGSWMSLHEFLDKDENGNVLIGDTINSNVSNSYIMSNERLTAGVGLDNIIIVDTKDSLLVASKDKSEDVKNILEVLEKTERIEKDFHREVFRPWGKYDSIDNGDGFQVKRITVKPKQKLSVQMHHHRAEHWVVVKGIGRVHYGDKYKDLKVNESTYHDKEVIHALENPGDEPLILIEVQVGDYLGEDDIVRYEDIYGRS